MFLLATAVLTSTHSEIQTNAIFDDLQHRAVQFFWDQSNPDTGFTKDRASNFKTPDDHDVASCASTGFALVAYPIGVERHWLDRQKALARTRLTLKSMRDIAQADHGWFYHFTNWKTGQRVWKSEASSIDTSIFLGGLIAAERYWKDSQVTSLTHDILKRIDWKWMMTDGGKKPGESLYSMGWHPEDGFISARWSGYWEQKMIYIQGGGLAPNLPSGFDKTDRKIETYKGISFLTGGPLFLHEMSESFYDFSGMRDRRGFDYFVASKNAALANRQYCIDNPKAFKDYGPDFWGLSACDTPDGYQALGAPIDGEDDGTITPTSAIATLSFIPNEAKSFTESMFKNHHNAYGIYGFSNGVNPSRSWNGPDVIGIDLGMMLCAIENYRTQMIWKLSNSSPAIRLGFERAGFRKVKNADAGPLKA